MKHTSKGHSPGVPIQSFGFGGTGPLPWKMDQVWVVPIPWIDMSTCAIAEIWKPESLSDINWVPVVVGFYTMLKEDPHQFCLT